MKRRYWTIRKDEQSVQMVKDFIASLEYKTLFGRPFLCGEGKRTPFRTVETYSDEQDVMFKLACSEAIIVGPLE